jgi:hypothetical protein
VVQVIFENEGYRKDRDLRCAIRSMRLAFGNGIEVVAAKHALYIQRAQD